MEKPSSQTIQIKLRRLTLEKNLRYRFNVTKLGCLRTKKTTQLTYCVQEFKDRRQVYHVQNQISLTIVIFEVILKTKLEKIGFKN